MVEYFDLINIVEAELIQMPGDRSLYKGGLTIDSLRFLIAVALNPNAMDAVTVRFSGFAFVYDATQQRETCQEQNSRGSFPRMEISCQK